MTRSTTNGNGETWAAERVTGCWVRKNTVNDTKDVRKMS